MRICYGTAKCAEIDHIGEYPYPDIVEFNMAVWEHCEKCEAIPVECVAQEKRVISNPTHKGETG